MLLSFRKFMSSKNHLTQIKKSISGQKSTIATSSMSSSGKSDSLAIKSIKSNSSLKSSGSLSGGYRMKVLPIKALQDNYMYLLVDESTKFAAAVDPVNASAMSSAIYDNGVELKAILTTHHHHDHAHGNADLLALYPEITVYGGDNRIQALTKLVSHGEMIKLGTLNIECLSTPCHTKGHICYYVTCEPDPLSSNADINNSERVVFTGDTLFVAGCGRFFEGSSDQMDKSLNEILANLPSETKVYCGHEYTVANLKFALSVEPQNTDIKTKLAWAQSKTSKKEPTIPSTIGEEKKINPFMRLKKSQVKKYTGEIEELEVMTVLRQRKNEFGT